METHDPPAAPAAAYPRWILIDEYFGDSDDPDTRTLAHARTSKGRPISVSFVLASPPAASRLRLNSPGLPDNSGIPRHNAASVRCHAIAAHGDSVLVKIETRSNCGRSWGNCDDGLSSDHFIYCAGDAAAYPSRPPSLSMLPPCYLAKKEKGKPKEKRYLDVNGTALLRRGQDVVLVAALGYWVKKRDDVLEAELCLIRSDDWEWVLKRLPVIHDQGKSQEVSGWETDKVIPVEDRFLVWVDYLRGIIYADLSQDTPELHYVSLPVEPKPKPSPGDRGKISHRSVCATDGGRTVRFVEILPRCCCGCPGQTTCAVSRYAFTMTTWALRMDDMMTWDKVGVMDCHELWSLPGYHGVVPRIRPKFPTVSFDDPDVLCFMVHKNEYDEGVDGDLGKRLIELNTSRMELRSICYYDREFYFCSNFVTSAASQYFDTSSHNRTLARRIDADVEARAKLFNLKLSCPRVACPEDMLATLREIPDLVGDDMMKAYDVLLRDESKFKFRSLLALPMDMRKDYCLVIGKLSCFDQ